MNPELLMPLYYKIQLPLQREQIKLLWKLNYTWNNFRGTFTVVDPGFGQGGPTLKPEGCMPSEWSQAVQNVCSSFGAGRPRPPGPPASTTAFMYEIKVHISQKNQSTNGNKLTCGSLWVVTSTALELITIMENPGAHHLWWHKQVFPFYRSIKRGKPGQLEKTAGIGCFQRTKSWGSCHQDVWQTPDDLIRGSH